MTAAVSFDVTREEFARIERILERAKELGLCRGPRSGGHWYEPLTLMMDLEACHANGCPLDFDRLLSADDFNFTHDIAGIARHMDRETGKLTGCFLPRFARH